MPPTQSAERIRVEVFRWRHRHFDPHEKDPEKWEVEDKGIAIWAWGGPVGPDSVSLGTVEVPGDADVLSTVAVTIRRFGDRKHYPGVPSVELFPGLKHFAYAENILDIAARPDLFGDLGITLVVDRRPEVAPCR